MKKPFLSATPPSLTFYHRFLRILLGIVLLIVSIYRTIMLPGIILVMAFAMDTNVGDILLLSLIPLYLVSSITWIVAAMMLIFKPLNQRGIWGTLCTLSGFVSLVVFYYVFVNTDDSMLAILLVIALLIHLCSAIGVIYFSRKPSTSTPVTTQSHLIE